MKARIAAISTYLPPGIETNDDIAKLFPEWPANKIFKKTGIYSRHVSSETEFTSDLAVKAAERLFAEHGIDPISVGSVILVTQTPDFILPTTACIVHDQLGLSSSVGAFDINLGCSGFVYGLAVAKGLVESGQSSSVLLLTSDTYTKLINPHDKSVRTVFGDGATATWITGGGSDNCMRGFSQGTDGSGAGKLLVPNGSLRKAAHLNPSAEPKNRSLKDSRFDLYMDGPGIFEFTLRTVGPLLETTLLKAGLSVKDVDYFVFHQANRFMLEHIVSKTKLPSDKCPIVMENWGNTISSTIPMALNQIMSEKSSEPKSRILLAGFGVGLSWAGMVIELDGFDS